MMPERVDKSDLVCCPECKAAIGTLVDIDGQQWLCTGNGIARAYHGVCARCGAEFHWVASDHMLAELVRRVLELRKQS